MRQTVFTGRTSMPALSPDTIDPIVVDRQGLAAFGIRFTNAWLLRMEQQGRFPHRIALGPRKCVWVVQEIRDWVAARASQRATHADERRNAVRASAGAQTTSTAA